MHTIGSLFAGVGGFDLAFERAGFRCAWQVEKDPAARSVLAAHWPDVPRFDDVCTVGSGELVPVDVICGGFPCQDLSVAGNRAGLAGARSGLFYEMTRIVDELQPAYLLWENVPGLLSSRSGRDFLSVLVELDRIGYSGCWTTLDAQFFGVPQRRQRIFGLFARHDIGAESCAEVLALTARLPWNTTPRPEARADIAGAIGESVGSDRERIASTLTANYGKQVDSSDTSQGPPNLIYAFAQNTRDEVRMLGGDGQIAGALGAQEGMKQRTYVASVGLSNRGHQTGAIAETLRADSNGVLPMVAATLNSGGNNGGFRTEPGAHLVAVRTANTGANGHGIAEDISHTLDGANGQAIGMTAGVRRLTPLECERLQGFPDNWTAGQADSNRYRQMGNAVAVPVVEWIARRVAGFLRGLAHGSTHDTPK